MIQPVESIRPMRHLLVISAFLSDLLPLSIAITTRCHGETGRCYWVGSEGVTWYDARTSCQSEGGDLAVIETEDLMNFVHTEFRYSIFPLPSYL